MVDAVPQPEVVAVALSDFIDAVALSDAADERDGDIDGEVVVENDRVCVHDSLGEPETETEVSVDTLSVAVETAVLDALTDDESETVMLPVADPDPLRVAEGDRVPEVVSEKDGVVTALADAVLVTEFVTVFVYEPLDEPVDEGVALNDANDAVTEADTVVEAVEDVVTVSESVKDTD